MSLPFRGPTEPSTLDPDGLELAILARRWLDEHSSPAVARRALEAEIEELPDFWPALVDLGWIGIAVPDGIGGQGGTTADLAVVLEEWGRAVAPGPFPGTAIVATILGRHAPALLPPVLAGEPAAIAVGCGRLEGRRVGDRLVVTGTVGPIEGGGLAARLLVPVDVAGAAPTWCLLPSEVAAVTSLRSADPTRRLASWTMAAADVGADLIVAVTDAEVERTVTVLRAAECVGVASWCVHTAAEHAIDRIQFGRPIGTFQAVKHRCADSLCRLEAARSVTWDAVGLHPDDEQFPVAAAAAGALAAEAAFECAKDAIQVLGGIGYTWEHDAHLYLRRGLVAHQFEGGGAAWRAAATAFARAGGRRTLRLDLPAEAEAHRAPVRDFIAELREQDRDGWNRELADGGWISPHWPTPWGRDADGLAQIVIDEEFREARIRRPHLQVAGWVLPTLIAYGTPEQQERFIPASMRGDLTWCQLFSEPGAGSDLASLTTRAERVDGGWSITGQKVWTTMAERAHWGICLARTNPAAPRHQGITCFLVEMSTPGLDIRPLRELTGFAMFNEVFLDGVFVPDECVVGEVDDGWSCARTTLENERVSMASGSSFGPGLEAVLDSAERSGALDDARVVDELGALLITAQALGLLGMRTALRALRTDGGAKPGPEASVRKLMAVEHEQAIQEMGMSLLGAAGAVDEGEGARWFGGFLGNRALSIAGGTSEIQRNVIAERLLGLPRDT